MIRYLRLAALLLVAVLLFGQHRGRTGAVPPAMNTPPPFKDVVVTFGGVVKKITKKELLLDLDESHELMTFRLNKETKYSSDGAEAKRTSIDLEIHVVVDAQQDTDSKLKALLVKAGQESKPAAAPAAK